MLADSVHQIGFCGYNYAIHHRRKLKPARRFLVVVCLLALVLDSGGRAQDDVPTYPLGVALGTFGIELAAGVKIQLVTARVSTGGTLGAKVHCSKAYSA